MAYYDKNGKRLKYNPKYATGNDNYGFIKNEVTNLIKTEDKTTMKGFQFFVPNFVENDYEYIRDYIEPRDIDNLKHEVYDMLYGKFAIFKSAEDMFYFHGFEPKSDNMVDEITDAINRNFTYCTSNFSYASIYAFRFIYRFNTKCNQENIRTIINFVADRFKNYIVVAQSNIMSNCIHFIISNHIWRSDIQEWYHDRYKAFRNYNGPDITFSRNPDKHMNFIQSRTNYLI